MYGQAGSAVFLEKKMWVHKISRCELDGRCKSFSWYIYVIILTSCIDLISFAGADAQKGDRSPN